MRSTTTSIIICFFAGLAVLADGAGKTPTATDLGYEALDKADYDIALARFNEAIQADAKNADAFQGRGLAHSGKGDLDSALADVTRAIELDSTQATAYRSRGTVYAARGEYDRAITDFAEAIRRNQEDATTYSNRGFAYLAKGEIERAISDCTEAIKLDPKTREAYYNRGLAYEQIGALDEAIQDFLRLVDLDRKCSEYHFRLGYAYFTNGDIDKALVTVNEAIQLFPDSAQICWLRGVILTSLRRFDEAIIGFTAATRLAPREPQILSNLAECYAHRNEYDKAIASYDAAIALSPRECCCYYERRGVLRIERGEYDRGIADIQAAIRQNGADPASAFEAWAKAPVSEADLEHGKRQVRQMLNDRPIMAQYSERAQVLCEWASRKFAGEDAGRRIFWRDSKLPPNTVAENDSLSIEKPAVIMVRAKIGAGPDTGRDLSFEELWCNVVFELYNVTNAKDILRLNELARDNRLSRGEYVKGVIQCETQAADKSRAFYIHVFLPWTRDNHVATYPGHWYVGWRIVSNENLLLGHFNRKTPYWRHYEFNYDLILLDSLVRKGEYQKAIDLAATIRGQADTPKDRALILRDSGYCLLQLEKASLAVDAFSEAISLDPTDYSSHIGRGQAYLVLGDTNRAMADCSEAIRRESSNAALYFLRARVYETMGEKQRAKADLAEAEQLIRSRR